VKLLMIKQLWGMEGLLPEQIAQIAQAGYDGIEAAITENDDVELLSDLLREHNLICIPQIQTVDNHYESFCRLTELSMKLSPFLIVAHSGRDKMTYDEQCIFFEKIMKYEKSFPVQIAHETHRSRPTYSPWSTNALLHRFPDMKLTADFSHWCCVCESLLEDMPDQMILPIQRSIHIHARVGYAQGPQVPDPRAPEYKDELIQHEKWWIAIARHLQAINRQEMTVTVEYGPPRYLHTLPYTDVPVSVLWDICLWATQRFKQVVKEHGLN